MRKKMIEVAIPLDAINKESAREKSIRHGHPSTLHLWWARRPLAACRAVLFTSLVDDPESDPANHSDDGLPDLAKTNARREELFALVSELVKWESTNNREVISRARAEIASSVASAKVYDSKEWSTNKVICGSTVGSFLSRTADPKHVNAFLLAYAPPVHDPFAGGGSIPLEAQRLGLRAFASDLNPVPVLINKALIELPPSFAGQLPVSRQSAETDSARTKARPSQKTFESRVWQGAEGLAEDIRAYGQWMRDKAEERIGHLYPKVLITPEMARERSDLELYVGQELTVIAWLWARTVPSPNPAAKGAAVPLIRSFWLSTKKGARAYVKPVLDKEHATYRFKPCVGDPPDGFSPKDATVSRNGGVCLLTGSPMPFDYIRQKGKQGLLGEVLFAIVAEGVRGRVYLAASEVQARLPCQCLAIGAPDTLLPDQALGFRVQLYGMTRHRDLFSSRQLNALCVFSDLVSEARNRVYEDAKEHYARSGSITNAEVETRAIAYADAVATYLGLAVSKSADYWSNLCLWRSDPKNQGIGHVFARHALQMVWDFAEANVFSESSGNWKNNVEWVAKVVAGLGGDASGRAMQRDATTPFPEPEKVVVSTDPPYYDNIGYADLSDFFYVWLRRSLGPIHEKLCATVLTPKQQELIATPHRFGGSVQQARDFFENGLTTVFQRVHECQDDQFPVTVYYAFKQTEAEEDDSEDDGEAAASVASTGWETMLEGLVSAEMVIVGTWPIRTEMGNRTISMGTNALASSIVLVCRPRTKDAKASTRRDFVIALKAEFPKALRELQFANIAPVDLAQAAIGPGMAVYSRYSKVLESSGERLTVRTALALINRVLDEVMAEQEGDYDADTRWSLKWFEQFAQEDGPFGDANTLATAMSIGINGLVETGIVQAKAGKVRLLKRTELMNGYPETWDPATDTDIVHWEVCQYLIHALDTKGEAGAAALLRRINARYPGAAETARELAYRLYTICERKKWAQEAMAYNSLIVAWPEIVKLAQSSDGSGGEAQTTMF